MKYKELTKEEAHNMTVKSLEINKNIRAGISSENSEGTSLDFDKQKIMEDIYTLIDCSFEVTFAVYKNDKCKGYFEGEDFLMKDYKDIKKWLISLGYKVSLFPAAWVPAEEHWLTVEWG